MYLHYDIHFFHTPQSNWKERAYEGTPGCSEHIYQEKKKKKIITSCDRYRYRRGVFTAAKS